MYIESKEENEREEEKEENKGKRNREATQLNIIILSFSCNTLILK